MISALGNAIPRHRSQLTHPSSLAVGIRAGFPVPEDLLLPAHLLPRLLLEDRAENCMFHRERRQRTGKGETASLWLQWDCRRTCPHWPGLPAFGVRARAGGVQASAQEAATAQGGSRGWELAACKGQLLLPTCSCVLSLAFNMLWY